MIEVPPPTSICTPRTVPRPSSSRVRARKATSWISEIARSAGLPSKEVLTLRGIPCVVGWRTK
jgi:hypothetical protein